MTVEKFKDEIDRVIANTLCLCEEFEVLMDKMFAVAGDLGGDGIAQIEDHFDKKSEGVSEKFSLVEKKWDAITDLREKI